MNHEKVRLSDAVYWIGFMYCLNLLASHIPALERYSPANEPYRSLIVGIIAWVVLTLYSRYSSKRNAQSDRLERS